MKSNMKLIVTTFLIFLFNSITIFSQIYIGASGGILSTSFTGDAPDDAEYTIEIGFSGGLLLDIPLTEDIFFSFQPRYLQKGTTISYDVGEDEYKDSLSVKMDYISFPVIVKIYSLNKRVFFSSGLDPGYLNNASLENLMDGSSSDINDFFEKWDISAAFGLGVNIPVGLPIISLELRYEQSLNNLSDISDKESGTTIPYRFRTTGFQLLVGVLIPL